MNSELVALPLHLSFPLWVRLSLFLALDIKCVHISVHECVQPTNKSVHTLSTSVSPYLVSSDLLPGQAQDSPLASREWRNGVQL